MKRAPREFRFELEALRNKRTWELDALRLDLAEAGRLLKQAMDQREALEIRFATARQEWSRRSGDASAIDLQWQRVATTYLADLRHRIVGALEEIRKLHEARERVMELVAVAHGDLEALEKRREQAIEAFIREASHRELARADESWLQRIPEEGAA